MGPTWVLSAPDGPHVGPMNFAIRVYIVIVNLCHSHQPHNPGHVHPYDHAIANVVVIVILSYWTAQNLQKFVLVFVWRLIGLSDSDRTQTEIPRDITSVYN